MLGVFLVFFSVLFSVAFFVRSWARPRGLWSPAWPQLGSILAPGWAFVVAFLGALLLSSLEMRWETISG